jgi:hypothetical protein
MQHQLELHRKKLLELCVNWQRGVQDIPPISDMSMSWGPSILDIATVNSNTLEDLVEYDESSSVESDMGDEDGEDAEVIDLLEDFGMWNVTETCEDEVDNGSDVADIYIARKRHRVE